MPHTLLRAVWPLPTASFVGGAHIAALSVLLVDAAAVTAAALAAAFTPGVTVAAVVLLQSLLRRFLCRTRCCARSQCCVAALAAAAVAVERKRNRYAVEHITCNNLLTYKSLTLSTHLFNAGAHTVPLPLQHWRKNVVWLKLG